MSRVLSMFGTMSHRMAWLVATVLWAGTAAIFFVPNGGAGSVSGWVVISIGVLCLIAKVGADHHAAKLERERRDAGRSLQCAVDEYCEQRTIREREHPWLWCSLATFGGAFASVISMAGQDNPDSWRCAVAGGISFLTMVGAGIHAEREPTEGSLQQLLCFLSIYKPQDQVELARLRSRVLDGSFTMELLVDFAAKECHAAESGVRREQALKYWREE